MDLAALLEERGARAGDRVSKTLAVQNRCGMAVEGHDHRTTELCIAVSLLGPPPGPASLASPAPAVDCAGSAASAGSDGGAEAGAEWGWRGGREDPAAVTRGRAPPWVRGGGGGGLESRV